MSRMYSLTAEPCGATYRALLDFAVPVCSRALLVEREGMDFAESAVEVVHHLHPYLISEEARSSWPGTCLFGHTATVRTYAYSAIVAELLKAAASCLFEWQQPTRPEDLCLLRDAGTPWLVTIAHERDAYFVLEEGEVSQLQNGVSGLARIVQDEY
jgi:hypothetical protein